MKRESLQKLMPALEPVLMELPGHLAAPMEIGMSALLPIGVFLAARLVARIPLFPALVIAGVGGGVMVGLADLARRKRTKTERDRLMREFDRMDRQSVDAQPGSLRGDHADR